MLRAAPTASVPAPMIMVISSTRREVHLSVVDNLESRRCVLYSIDFSKDRIHEHTLLRPISY